MTTDKIEPALSAEEWAAEPGSRTPTGIMLRDRWYDYEERAAPAMIALLNDTLSDSDHRKITRAWVKALRSASVVFRVGDHETMQDDEQTAVLRAMADALESYLPPEGP